MKKTLSAKILTSGLSFLLLFSNFPQEVLASRSNAGGGKAAKFDVGKVAMSIGIAVGSAAIGAGLSSAWSASSQAAAQSGQAAQQGAQATEQSLQLIQSTQETLRQTALFPTLLEPSIEGLSSAYQIIPPATQTAGVAAQAAGAATQTASTLSKFTQPFVNFGKSIANVPSTMKFIAQNPKTFTDGFTLAFKASNVVPTVIKGYNTYVAVTQVSRAVGTLASYKKWEPASTFLVSTVATMTTAGFLNPSASLGDSLSKTSSEFALPAMLKGAGVGTLGGLAGAGLTIAVDADKMNKNPKERSRDHSPSIGGRILGMAGTMLGTTLGRTLVDPKTYNTKLEEYAEDEKMKIYTSKTGDFISEKDLQEKAGLRGMEQAFRVQLGKDGKLDIRSAQQLFERATRVGEGTYVIQAGSDSVTFSLSDDQARFLESMRFAPPQEIGLKKGPGADIPTGETFDFKGGPRDLAQGGVRGGVTPGRTAAPLYLPQNISGSSLPLQRIFLNPLVETLNMWPLLAANALEIVVREKVISRDGQQSIWQPLVSGAVMALAAPVFESLANTYKLKPSLFSDIDQRLGYFPELQYARAEMFKDAIVRKGAKDVSKLSKEELTKKPTPVEKRELEDKINEEEFKLEEVEMQQEMHRLQNLPLSELEKEVLPKEIHLLKLKQEISTSSEEKELLENKISEKELKLAKANFNQEMKKPLTMDPIMDGLTTDRLTKYDPISKEIESRKNKLNKEIDLLKLKQEISLPPDLMERFSTTEQIQILSTLQAAKGKATTEGKNWTVADTRGALLEGLMAVANTRGTEKARVSRQDIFDHRPVLESIGGSRLGIVFDRTKDVFRYDLPVSLLSGIMEVGLNEISGVNKIQRLENRIARINSQKVRTGKDIAKIEKMEEKIDSLLLPSMLTSLGTNRITGAARGIAVYIYGKHLERKQKDEIETFGDKWEPALLTQRSLTDLVQIILARIEGTIPLPDDKKYDYKVVEYYNPETGRRLKPKDFKQEVLEPILEETKGKVHEEFYEVLKKGEEKAPGSLYDIKRLLQNERAAAPLSSSLEKKSDALNKWKEIGDIKENPNGSFKLAPGAEIPIDSTRYYGEKTGEGVKLIAPGDYRKVREIEGYARSLDPDTLSPAKTYFLPTDDPTKVVPLKDYDIAKVPSLGQAIMGSVTQGSFEFGWKGLAMGLPHRREGKLSAFEWYSYTRNLNSLASASASAAKGQGYANTMLRHQANVATGMSTNNLFTILNEAIDLGMAKVVGVSGYKKGLPYNEVLLLDVGWYDKEPRSYPYWPFFEVTPVPNDHFWAKINKGLKREIRDGIKKIEREKIGITQEVTERQKYNLGFLPSESEQLLLESPKPSKKYEFPIPPEPKPEDVKPWGPDLSKDKKERTKEIDKVVRSQPEEKALEGPLSNKAEEIARRLEMRNNKSSNKADGIPPFVSAGQDAIDSKDIIFSTEEDRENEVIRQEDIIFSTEGAGKTPALGEDTGFTLEEVNEIIKEGQTPPKIEALPPLLPNVKKLPAPEGIPPRHSSKQGLHERWDNLGSSEEPSSEEENTKSKNISSAQTRIPKIDINSSGIFIEPSLTPGGGPINPPIEEMLEEMHLPLPSSRKLEEQPSTARWGEGAAPREIERVFRGKKPDSEPAKKERIEKIQPPPSRPPAPSSQKNTEIKIQPDPNSMVPRLLHDEQLRQAQKESDFSSKAEAIEKALKRLDEVVPLYVGDKPVTRPTRDRVISDGTTVEYSPDYKGPAVIGRDLEGNPIFSKVKIDHLTEQDLLDRELRNGMISPERYNQLKNNEFVISPVVVAFLEELDKEIQKKGGKVEPTSGYRNPEYQDFVSGFNPAIAALDSHHPDGDAVDFKVTGLKDSEVYRILKGLLGNDGGIGRYKDSDHWHIDLRTTPEGEKPARWNQGQGAGVIPKEEINDPNTYPIDKIMPVVDGIKKEESGRGKTLRWLEDYLGESFGTKSHGDHQINEGRLGKLLKDHRPPPEIQELIDGYNRQALGEALIEGGSGDPNRKILYDPLISRWLAEKIVEENFGPIAKLAARNGQPFTDEAAKMITAAMYNQGPENVWAAIIFYNIDKLSQKSDQPIKWSTPELDTAERYLPAFLTSVGKRLGFPIGVPLSEVREKRLEQTEEFLLGAIKDGELPGITSEDVKKFVTRHFSVNGGEQITTSTNEIIIVPVDIGKRTIVQLLQEKGYADLPDVLAVDGKIVRLIDGDYRQYGIAPQVFYSNVFNEITKLQGDNFKLFPSPKDVKKDPPAGILSPLNYGLRVVDGLSEN